MKTIQNSSLLEKSFAFVFLIVFFIFAVFFTASDLKDAEDDYNKQRILFTKKQAHEICDLLEKRIDVSSRLSNLLAENTVVYAVVHLSDGSLLARSEGYAIPVGIFEIAEEKALKTEYLTMTSFKDASGRLSLVESAIPIFTKEHIKYILRLGFLKDSQEEKLSYLKLRNILVFSLIFIFILSIWQIKKISFYSKRYTLLVLITFVLMFLFFTSAYVIRSWYSKAWLDNYIDKECISKTKMLVPSVISLIEKNSSSEFNKSVTILEENDNCEMVSVVKDDNYIFHRDVSKIGSAVSNEYYRKSLNSDNPSVFKSDSSDIYTAIIPVLEGNHRIGSIISVWNTIGKYKAISLLRNKLTIIFICSFLLIYWFIYIVTDKDASNKLDLNQLSIVQDSSDSKKDTDDSNNKPIHSVVSIFLYFSGINEAIHKLDTNLLSKTIDIIYTLVKSLLENNKKHKIELRTDGILILFTDEFEQNSVYDAISFAKLLKNKLSELESLAFSPKISIHICNVLQTLNDNNNSKSLYFGDCLIDYKTVAKIQSENDFIFSRDFYEYFKELAYFDTLEVLSPDCGKFNVYSLSGFKDIKDLINNFNQLTNWTKLMILRILKEDNDFDINKINDLIKDCDSFIKDNYVKYIH